MSNNRGDKVLSLFDSINSYSDIRKLISDGENEDQHLECKSPVSISSITKGFQLQIGRLLSGFSNAGGGIIIFGVSTSEKHGLDVLTQIDPIGLITRFAKKLQLKIPLLTDPSLEPQLKILKENSSDKKGVIILYVPKNDGDPISTTTGKFYLRVGDRTSEMPYETLKRMFRGSSTPNLDAGIPTALVEYLEDDSWKIPFVIRNLVNVPARSVSISITINNHTSCANIRPETFQNVSKINPDKKMYSVDLTRPIHKGLDILAGYLAVNLKPRKRMLVITISVYAEFMNAKKIQLRVGFNKSKKKIIIKDKKESSAY